ncbi:MAG TPA: hypothetical protein VMY37_33285, partial [Thermoguttaceae bacterium]|nr:hypothetical protein [Thermoguttaceae bacterium]
FFLQTFDDAISAAALAALADVFTASGRRKRQQGQTRRLHEVSQCSLSGVAISSKLRSFADAVEMPLATQIEVLALKDRCPVKLPRRPTTLGGDEFSAARAGSGNARIPPSSTADSTRRGCEKIVGRGV